MKKYLVIIFISILLSLTTVTSANTETKNTTIILTVNNQETTAHMINNPTSDEFLKLLPLDLELNDLLQREKYAQLPQTISDQTEKTKTYEVGYIAYYPPTNSIAIYYDNDHEEIKEGIIPIAIIDNNIDIFKENHEKVRIELIE
ncbi:MAG: hypothetical protein IJJ47_06230 [Methanosphaera sp.]|nr:hypothetical protein [Methanosphaera sp.]